MPAAALLEGEEAGADEADVRWGEGEFGAEADFEDEGGEAGGLHVLG